MGIPQDDMNFALSTPDHPLSKRRRFTPVSTSPFSQNTWDSPILQHSDLSTPSPLPHEIQADLLQVGMRIRKAVPEGYKTHKFTPRPFFNMRRLSPETAAAITGTPTNNSSTPDLSPYAASRIHAVGGMSMQPLTTATFCGVNLAALPPGFSDSAVDNGNTWLSPSTSSQSLWSYSTSHKRPSHNLNDSDEYSDEWSPQTPTLIAEAGSGMPVDYFAIEQGYDMENVCDVSPLTQGPHHRRQNSFPFKQTSAPELNIIGGMGRKVAKPKSRIRNPHVPQQQIAFNPFASLNMNLNMSMISEQEVAYQGMMSCGMEMSGNDFSEAGFLQRREDVEMDCS